jgi:hypothetical protein
VRALYRDILRAAAAHGIARRAGETPDEYGPRLGAALPDGVQPTDVRALSEAYDAARYGETEPEDGARRTVREQAGRVLRALRRRAD